MERRKGNCIKCGLFKRLRKDHTCEDQKSCGRCKGMSRVKVDYHIKKIKDFFQSHPDADRNEVYKLSRSASIVKKHNPELFDALIPKSKRRNKPLEELIASAKKFKNRVEFANKATGDYSQMIDNFPNELDSIFPRLVRGKITVEEARSKIKEYSSREEFNTTSYYKILKKHDPQFLDQVFPKKSSIKSQILRFKTVLTREEWCNKLGCTANALNAAVLNHNLKKYIKRQPSRSEVIANTIKKSSKTLSISQWSEKLGVPYDTIKSIVRKYHIKNVAKVCKSRKDYSKLIHVLEEGKSLTTVELSKITGLKVITIRSFIKRNEQYKGLIARFGNTQKVKSYFDNLTPVKKTCEEWAVELNVSTSIIRNFFQNNKEYKKSFKMSKTRGNRVIDQVASKFEKNNYVRPLTILEWSKRLKLCVATTRRFFRLHTKWKHLVVEKNNEVLNFLKGQNGKHTTKEWSEISGFSTTSIRNCLRYHDEVRHLWVKKSTEMDMLLSKGEENDIVWLYGYLLRYDRKLNDSTPERRVQKSIRKSMNAEYYREMQRSARHRNREEYLRYRRELYLKRKAEGKVKSRSRKQDYTPEQWERKLQKQKEWIEANKQKILERNRIKDSIRRNTPEYKAKRREYDRQRLLKKRALDN